MKREPTFEDAINAFARLSRTEQTSLLWEVVQSPEWIANSHGILKDIKEAGAMNDVELSLFVSMLENSSAIATYLYGNATNRQSLIALAEEVKFCRNLDPAKASGRELTILSRFLSRVKSATDKLDVQFFRDLSEAVDLARAAHIPAGSREALYIAMLIRQIFTSVGLTPTKADIKREVKRLQKILGRRGGPEGDGATILWQRDVWKHPELADLKVRTKGQSPVYLPEAWYLRNGGT